MYSIETYETPEEAAGIAVQMVEEPESWMVEDEDGYEHDASVINVEADWMVESGDGELIAVDDLLP